MQAKQRYSALFLSLLLGGLLYLASRLERRGPVHRKARKSYLKTATISADPLLPKPRLSAINTSLCRMETCFNFSLCEGRPFRVYVYPLDEAVPPSSSYMKILSSLRESRYYTDDPSLACIFVLSLDTLDRDSLSQDFVRNMPARLEKLPTWRNGQNHLVFNLYSGTWPDYAENLNFDIGRAILAKASMSVENYRPGFDISLPLFHKHHPGRGGAPGLVTSNMFPLTNKHFLAFKGKRYVHGIGSDTRNSLHHLHNGRDIVMVTTCKHGKNWRDMMDERCDEDNAEYDRWDYEELLSNSTFCLVPRGRRLGSFRFLETLQAGCLPVILSNGWQLPLAEVLDWTQATVILDERQLLQVSEVLYSLTRPQIFAMRQQTQVLWDRYLSSVQKIVDTTLEILFQRIYPQLSKPRHAWNSPEGALIGSSTELYDSNLPLIPLNLQMYSNETSLMSLPTTSLSTRIRNTMFTAVIAASPSLTITSSSPIFKLIKNIAACKYAGDIIIIWSSRVKPPPIQDWRFLGGLSATTPLYMIHNSSLPSNISARFLTISRSNTEAVLSLDDDVTLTTSEIDFAFEVWKHFKNRIVGFPARTHYWDDERHTWVYSSKWSNEYSIVLTNAAFLSNRFARLFLSSLPQVLMEEVQKCEHLLINFVAAHITKLSPIKVTQRKRYRESFTNEQEWKNMQTCINEFAGGFGYMPLVKSQVRLDPVLFKDPVSNLRKKYRKMELVQ